MRALAILFALVFSAFIVNVSYSDDWKTKKWSREKTASSEGNTSIQGYSSGTTQNHPVVYLPQERPPVDLSESGRETVYFPDSSPPLTVSLPNQGPSMTVGIPGSPSETASFPNSGPSETVTPLPGYSEPEQTVEFPE